jgi:S-formylglutathione hydrolase FrmB
MNQYKTWRKTQPFRLGGARPDRWRRLSGWLAIGVGAFTLASPAAPRLEVLELASRALKHNPLGDPVTRRVAVFVPDPATNGMPLPIVYYLPGFGGSSENTIKDPSRFLKTTEELAQAGTPVVVVVVDAKTRWGGSQYLNSPAQGNYADYICDEIVPLVEHRYGIAPGATNRIIAGHSSGGFGALRLGLLRPRLFGGVVALSPDSYFEISHRYLVTKPSVTNLSPAELTALIKAPPGTPPPKDGDLKYALALSAAYAPRGRWHPGEFEWLCDEWGQVREKVWQRWLDNDPLIIVQKNRHAFRDPQAIYVEGPTEDAYKANLGARKIYEILRRRPARCTFYEPIGKHSDHVPERLERGIAWIFGRL